MCFTYPPALLEPSPGHYPPCDLVGSCLSATSSARADPRLGTLARARRPCAAGVPCATRVYLPLAPTDHPQLAQPCLLRPTLYYSKLPRFLAAASCRRGLSSHRVVHWPSRDSRRSGDLRESATRSRGSDTRAAGVRSLHFPRAARSRSVGGVSRERAFRSAGVPVYSRDPRGQEGGDVAHSSRIGSIAHPSAEPASEVACPADQQAVGTSSPAQRRYPPVDVSAVGG